MSSLFRDPKRLLATLIAGVTGLIVLIDFALPLPDVGSIAALLVSWAAIVTALALVVGLINVIGTHLRRVSQRQSDWVYSILLLVAMLATILAGTLYPLQRIDGGITFPSSLIEQPIRTIFNVVYQPLAASFLALLAFFSLSAALRAVRRPTADAIVIVGIALVVLLITAIPQLDTLLFVGEGVRWMNEYLVLAGARGLLLGSAIGALVAGVRVLLGFDQPFLDR